MENRNVLGVDLLDPKSFGNVVVTKEIYRAVRVHIGLSQQQLGSLLDKSDVTIQRREYGSVGIKKEAGLALLMVGYYMQLGCNYDELKNNKNWDAVASRKIQLMTSVSSSRMLM